MGMLVGGCITGKCYGFIRRRCPSDGAVYSGWFWTDDSSLYLYGRWIFKTPSKKILFNNSGKNWAFLFVALFLETVVFGASSAGIISSIPRTPVAVIVVLIVFLQAAILYGGNEELGWRGIMQPILQQKMKSPMATFITGMVWVCWHIPLWFIEGNSHQSMSFFTFAILGIALSYWLSAIYNLTGAVVFCMIMHGWTNTLMGVLDMKESGTYYIGLVLLTMASIVASVKAEYK